MRKKTRKPPRRKIVLRLPDLDHTTSAVLNSLSSPHSRRNYKFAMEQFMAGTNTERVSSSPSTPERCRDRVPAPLLFDLIREGAREQGPGTSQPQPRRKYSNSQ